jgi:hypothetical protein
MRVLFVTFELGPVAAIVGSAFFMNWARHWRYGH